MAVDTIAQSSTVRVLNETKQRSLGDNVTMARTFWSRGKGLMFRANLSPGTGLVIDPCSSIHSFWMRFPIDVLYVDGEGVVLRADRQMVPWRLGPLFVRHGRYVIELPAGSIEQSQTVEGDRVRLEPAVI